MSSLSAFAPATPADGLPTLYAGPYPPGAPDAIMTCRFSGGEKPEKYLAGTRTALHRCTVTVLVRGECGPDGYSEGIARAAWEAMYDAHPEGYVYVDVEKGGLTGTAGRARRGGTTCRSQ
ncbi:hypothetical protein [Cystobacter fuscus]|uniref:hypothetical protein n=1 Tax=Cystobacter fuscus TaxID=43 RepID=UPI0037C05183